VQADAHERREAVLISVARKRSLDRGRAADGIVGPAEDDEEPVAAVLDHLSAPLVELGPQRAVVPTQQLLPRGVADASASRVDSTMSENM